MHFREALSGGLLALLAIVSPLYLIAAFNGDSHSLPVRNDLDKLPDGSNIQPGIGFDLTAFYGTAAISYSNGTILPIARVEATKKYRETWKRLSLKSSKHLAPPYDYIFGSLDDWPRQQMRKWRQRFGFPASADVGTIAEMLAALRDQAELFTGGKVTSAVVTIPHLVALYDEDIVDAFYHVGMTMSRQSFYEHLVYESATAYAGSGFGLCSNFTDIVGCRKESYRGARDPVMIILYTREGITITVPVFDGLFSLWEPLYRLAQDWTLGSNELLARTTQEAIDEYWALVRELIFNLYTLGHFEFPSKIILKGESAEDSTFRQNVIEALEFVSDGRKIPPILDVEPMYLAAKGAAEFAKRSPWTERWLTGPIRALNSSALETTDVGRWRVLDQRERE
ncbi:Hypothetical protein D9617_22g067030 [Elsinoe fawcettii]|nr:Hypothetical protein D9617_22g067030 [Elsinoe fawcettii]